MSRWHINAHPILGPIGNAHELIRQHPVMPADFVVILHLFTEFDQIFPAGLRFAPFMQLIDEHLDFRGLFGAEDVHILG